ncbi:MULTISPECIES: quinone-dependent dihydroorotate dehydrogenase [Micromonospora]|uniref:Dihydroorotate dehydrogenase (quinone) n=1 Tax=Micromonospora yangpuensis TaxID=683228 RepID=A0A1C6UIC5_9ACTN|nr:quinone-dependent dihydroorotate dehydrogenase [Micromonospora yangpuensis]GGM03199.1 dihydroorotate dehydrogenase (quinone) [Micromonospora yangpuensis]SCL53845.1 dihydroorotate oxidase A [Micromonospora yangpuensis]
MIFERAVRPWLFRLGGGDAEAAHDWTLRRLAVLARQPAALAALRARYLVQAPRTVFGVRFPNPVGLAAGMDKNGLALPAWSALGFGFVEVGTVTAHAQPGNPRPRLFRLPDSAAVVNRMGFNNAGAEALAVRLAALPRPLGVPLGISLGKSKVTPLDEAVEDYLASYRALRSHGDYFAVNVSSPNTPGLRSLQDKEHLDALLAALVGEKPVLVKIAPDLTEPAIAELLEVCLARGAAGVIATNTTLSRDGLAAADRPRGAQAGGLSGRPLAERARAVVSFVHTETGGRLPVVGVGGILDPDDATRMFDAGASLVQLYTGFIYRGPGLTRAVARAAAGVAPPTAATLR